MHKSQQSQFIIGYTRDSLNTKHSRLLKLLLFIFTYYYGCYLQRYFLNREISFIRNFNCKNHTKIIISSMNNGMPCQDSRQNGKRFERAVRRQAAHTPHA